MKRAWGCFALFFLLGAAQARTAPYTDWAFDVEKATKADDLDALGALAKAEPEFARVYFYGQVYDLVTRGIPERHKSALRPRLDRMAAVFAEETPPDQRPQLLLDRVDTGQLEAEAKKARELQERLVGAARAGGSLPPRVAPAEHVEIAEAVFYALFYRAEIARRRLGGERERAMLVTLAQRMAEGFALAHNDLRPWKTLSKWSGGAIQLEGQGVLEEQLGGSLNANLAGDYAAAQQLMNDALFTARGNRGGSIFTALILNGTAQAAGWMNALTQARNLHLQVLHAVRPLGKPALVALIASELIRSHLTDKTLDDMVAYTRELRALGPPATRVGLHLRTMEQAAEALRQAAAERIASGRLGPGERLLEEAEGMTSILLEEEAIAVNTPHARRDAVRNARARARAFERRLAATLQTRRGQVALALKALKDARALYQKQDDEAFKVEIDLLIAEAHIKLGAPDKALPIARTHWKALGDDQPKLIAHAYLVEGLARVRRGEWAPAFLAANTGLSYLVQGGVNLADAPMRARLHTVAGLALHAAGYPEGLGRLTYALSLNPTEPELAAMVALGRAQMGQFSEALAALDPFKAGEIGRLMNIYRGCIHARAGQNSEAKAALSELRSLLLPHFQYRRNVGRVCLATVLIAERQLAAADKVLEPTRAWLAEHPEPALAWRVAALSADIATRGRRWREALDGWSAAAKGFTEAGRAAAPFGVTLDVATFATPDRFDATPAPLVAIQAARAEKDAKVAKALRLQGASLGLWAQAMDAAAPVKGWAPRDEGRPGRAQLGRLPTLRAALSDGALTKEELAAVGLRLKELSAALEAPTRAADKAHKGLSDYHAPIPQGAEALTPKKGYAHAYYFTGQTHSALYLHLPGGETHGYLLPSEDQIERLLKPALDEMLSPPKGWPGVKRRPRDPNTRAWRTLAKPVEKVMPFLAEKKLRAKVSKLRLQVFPDGPLSRFPLDALVLEAPKSPGEPPLFVGAATPMSYRFSLQRGRRISGGGGMTVFGPLPGGACPGKLCEGIDQELEVTQIQKQMGGSATVLSGEGATLDAFKDARKRPTTLHVLSPLDAAAGAPLFGAAEALKALTPLELSKLKGMNTGALFTRLTPPSAEDARGLRRLGAALRSQGTREIVLVGHRTPTDSYFAGEIAKLLSEGHGLASSLHATQWRLMHKVIDTKEGGPALHHPFFWGRWMLYAPLKGKALALAEAELKRKQEKAAEPPKIKAPDFDAKPKEAAKPEVKEAPEVKAAPKAEAEPAAVEIAPSGEGASTIEIAPSTGGATGDQGIEIPASQ